MKKFPTYAEFVKLFEKGTEQEIIDAINSEINVKGIIYDTTALICAAGSNTPEVIEILLKAGSDVNAQDDYNNTALIYAAEKNTFEVVNLLLRAGADVNIKGDYEITALMMAIDQNTFDVVNLLLNVGADINAKTDSGFTPLMFAVWNKKFEIIETLLKMGADVKFVDMFGKKVIDYAHEIDEYKGTSILVKFEELSKI